MSDQWTAKELQLDENERRVTHFALGVRVAKKDKTEKSTLPSKKRDNANLLERERTFLALLAESIASVPMATYEVDDQADYIVAGVESLRALSSRINAASPNSLAALGLSWVSDFGKAALAAFMQAAPSDCHEYLKLEVVNGVVRDAYTEEGTK